MRSPRRSTYSERKHVVVDVSTDTDTTIVAALAGKRIVVLDGELTFPAGAGTHVWKSGSTALSGAIGMGANAFGGIFQPNEEGWLRTAVGEPLVLTTAGGATVKGFLGYVEETAI